jgi:hypothetical protein
VIDAGEWMPEAGSEATDQARTGMCKGRIGTQKRHHSGDDGERLRMKRSRNGLGMILDAH